MVSSSSDGGALRLPSAEVDNPTIAYDEDDPSPGTRAIPRPSKLGRYTILEVLGVGGMGYVCTAYDPKLDRKVAIKLLRERDRGGRRSTTSQVRLVREAQALAQLSHPNVVTVHDVDTEDDKLFMAMEFVDGESIERWMKTPRPWREVMEVFASAARGLAAAHEAGITHRDFKPSNVLLSRDGRVVVVDFGLAKSEGRPVGDQHIPVLVDDSDGVMEVIGSTQDAKLTQAGRAVGTPAYMAPEQFLGRGADSKTDQYSFGVSLYEALYGDLPFPDATARDLMEMASSGILVEQPPDSMVPGWLFKVVQQTLHPRPEGRYASMHEVIAALEADAERRRRGVVLGATGTVLAGLAAVIFYMQGGAAAAETCTGAPEHMAQVWSDAHEQRVREAFVATGKPFAEHASGRATRELDAYRGRWEELHTEICEATAVRQEQSEALMDARMACLEQGRRELDALVDLLVEADGSVVLKAHELVQDLPDLEACPTQEPDDAMVPDPKLAQAVAELEETMARARILGRAGKLELAFETADDALERAKGVEHPPSLARAQLLAATLGRRNRRDADEIRDELITAIDLAQRTQQPSLEVRGWAQLMRLEAGPLHRPHDALAMRVPAKLAVSRAGDPTSAAELARTAGIIHWRAREFEPALEHFEAAREAFERELGGDSYQVAALWLNICGTLGELERFDEAERAIDGAIEILQTTAGPDHPLLAKALLNRGSVMLSKGDPEGALGTYTEAVRIYGLSLPATHPSVLKARTGVGQALQRLGRLDEAESELNAILRLFREADGSDLFAHYHAHFILGDVLLAQARVASDPDPAMDRARAQYLEAIEVLERRGGPSSEAMIATMNWSLCSLELDRNRVETALAHCEIAWNQQLETPTNAHELAEITELFADAHRRRDQLDDAIDVLQRALAVMGQDAGDDAAVLRLALADSLWARAEPEAARDEARRALELVSDEEPSPERDGIEAWLRAHPEGDP